MDQKPEVGEAMKFQDILGHPCACGHGEYAHESDPSGSGNTPCWESLTYETNEHGYPLNRCLCNEYRPK